MQAGPCKFVVKSGVQVLFSSIVITGPRVLLVPVEKSLAAEIFSEFTPEITRFMYPKPAENVERVEQIIELFAESRRRKEELVSAIVLRATGEFLGCCGLHGRDNSCTPELGLWVKKAAHGNRYGREAIHTLAAWAAENLVVDGFLYAVDKRNIASRKIPESLGGSVVAEKVIASQSGELLDEVVYFIGAKSLPTQLS
jgi:ribosomal-protein-alanine N-acetyltransferase